MIQKIKGEIENVLYPELRPHGRADRDRFLKKASDTPLDYIEWTGTLIALVFVAVLSRYSVAELGLIDRIAVILVNFLVAIVLLGLTVGPFLVRRTRRGLRVQLHGNSN